MAIFPWPKNSGKVARLLMNLMLLRDGFPPVVIHSIERQRYYEVLRSESAGLVPLVLESLENGVETGDPLLPGAGRGEGGGQGSAASRSSARSLARTSASHSCFPRTLSFHLRCAVPASISSSRTTRRQLNASIDFDRRLLPFDIEGSKAHARMLAAQGILSAADAEAICARPGPGGRRVEARRAA